MSLKRELVLVYKKLGSSDLTPIQEQTLGEWSLAGTKYNLDDYVVCFEHADNDVIHTVLIHTEYSTGKVTSRKELDRTRLRLFRNVELEGNLCTPRSLADHAHSLHKRAGDVSSTARDSRRFATWITEQLEQN